MSRVNKLRSLQPSYTLACGSFSGKAFYFMKLVNIKIISLFIISYSLALIAMTPLSWVLPLVEPRLAPLGVRVTQPQGSLWSGQAVLMEQNLGRVNVQWDIKVASLLLLKLPVDVELSNSNLALSGLVTVGVGGPSLANWSGYIDDKALRSVYQRYRATINGRLQLDTVAASMSWGHQLKEASGSATWSGGAATVPVGRSARTFEVPMMHGDIASDENAWHFVANSSDGQALIEAELTREGMGTVSVKSAMTKALGLSIPSSGENVFKMSQQVF
jgi:hypothetical protein